MAPVRMFAHRFMSAGVPYETMYNKMTSLSHDYIYFTDFDITFMFKPADSIYSFFLFVKIFLMVSYLRKAGIAEYVKVIDIIMILFLIFANSFGI